MSINDRDEVLRAVRESPNLGVAAERLHVSRRTLQNRMREYGMPYGKSGRRKRSLKYRKRPWLTGVAVAAVATVGAALAFRSRGRSV